MACVQAGNIHGEAVQHVCGAERLAPCRLICSVLGTSHVLIHCELQAAELVLDAGQYMAYTICCCCFLFLFQLQLHASCCAMAVLTICRIAA